jgi:hypothetical protein
MWWGDAQPGFQLTGVLGAALAVAENFVLKVHPALHGSSKRWPRPGEQGRNDDYSGAD